MKQAEEYYYGRMPKDKQKANAYQRENEILIRKIDSSLTVEELLRHLSKGGGNSVVIGIK